MSEPLTDPPVADAPEPATAPPAPSPPPCEGPPPTERPPEPTSDPRAELLRMAATLARTRNDRLLVEYLRLRRAAG